MGFHAGEMALVMGPSGSGKTTLLSVLGCLLTPDSGNVSVMGRRYATFRKQAQRHKTTPHRLYLPGVSPVSFTQRD
jgi:ABC-type lipoprotein export system ATPase subunit